MILRHAVHGVSKTICAVLSALVLFSGAARSESNSPPADSSESELNTILMNATFMITGPSRIDPRQTMVGTGFLIGKPKKGAPNDLGYYVLVTAAHVFQEIDGDVANINVREKQSDGSYKTSLWPLKIRSGDKPIYVQHPEADVAAMFVKLPASYYEKIWIGSQILATDDVLRKFEVHPGDELRCLGYPRGITGSFGFPLLRLGTMASYPLVPSKMIKNWAFDFAVFGGNSGGPVYLVDKERAYEGGAHLGETVQIVIGLVTEQLSVGQQDLHLAVIIPATFIQETIDLLPDDPAQ